MSTYDLVGLEQRTASNQSIAYQRFLCSFAFYKTALLPIFADSLSRIKLIFIIHLVEPEQQMQAETNSD